MLLRVGYKRKGTPASSAGCIEPMCPPRTFVAEGRNNRSSSSKSGMIFSFSSETGSEITPWHERAPHHPRHDIFGTPHRNANLRVRELLSQLPQRPAELINQCGHSGCEMERARIC